MKILFTGASSFTGHWFVIKLAERGHDVYATFTRANADDYGSDVRSQRVHRILDKCHPKFSCRFGDENFLKLLKDEKFELLCHHAADVTNYRSPDFDVERAVANNTFHATDVLRSLKADSGSLLLTGSFFEPGEGAGSAGLPAFSPYGVSKRQTADAFLQECQKIGGRMGKFVISNPFGPWEDPRFISYLARTWSAGQVAAVRTPDYIRDNIPVSLLSAAYVEFAEQLSHASAIAKFNPRGYVETQGAFSERVAREMRSRTSWECGLELAVQTVFDEPLERMNIDQLDESKLGWSESAAWDELATYYERTLAGA
jgi:nucleoside-diphosphate-sugar epimerase